MQARPGPGYPVQASHQGDSMLRILYRLAETDTIEANLVAEAANRLGVGEFQFFQLAHEAWFGATVNPEALEPVFLSYMLNDNVPPYVRHFARNVIQRDDAGKLDAQADEFHRFDRGTTRRALLSLPRGVTIVTLVVVFTATFMALMLYQHRPAIIGTPNCQFPPCPFVP